MTVSISGLTIENGSASSGAGIDNNGTLTLNNDTLSDNSASGRNGGGIYNTGTLTLSNDTLSDNSAQYGGGVSNGGTMTLSNGSQIDVTTGLSYVDPKSLVDLGNGAYLNTATNIMTESDGTQIDIGIR